MNANQFRELLRSTLNDLHVSRRERQTLAAQLQNDPPNQQQWGEFRAVAFGLAREALTVSPQPAAVLNWLEDTIKVLIPDARTTTTSCRGDVCFSPGDDCRNRIAGLIQVATRTLDICVFTITDNLIAEALLQAHRRGVRLRIITDDLKSADRGSDVDRLEAAGVPVRVDRTKHHMHHKFAIFDQLRLVTGSYNWTIGAAFDNEEDIVILGDAVLIERFQEEFDRLWDEYR
ncbi:MAG: phospholipase D-like domain-containing protein [Planctomycetaceae bacterium]